MQVIEPVYSPHPVCLEHDALILYCDPCCVRIYEFAGWDDVKEDFVMDAFARHSWAMANVYQAKELW